MSSERLLWDGGDDDDEEEADDDGREAEDDEDDEQEAECGCALVSWVKVSEEGEGAVALFGVNGEKGRGEDSVPKWTRDKNEKNRDQVYGLSR